MDLVAAYSSSDDETDTTCRNSPKSTSPPLELVNLVLYLENYAMNKNLASGFFLLPWKPDPKIAIGLQRAIQEALRLVQKDFPDLITRYLWHPVGSQKPVLFGRFGYTNVRSLNNPHVSMFPNFTGPRNRFDVVHTCVVQGMKSIRPHQDMLVTIEANKVDQMLGKRTKQVVRIRANPHLRCYMSGRTGSIFVALDVARVVKTNEYKFLRQVSKAIDILMRLNEFKFDWKSMGAMGALERDGLPYFPYHMTVLYGELHQFLDKIKPEEFDRLREVLASVDVSEYTGDLNLDMEVLELRDGDGKVKTISLLEGCKGRR